MKKVLLILIAVGISYYSFGQKATKLANTNKISNTAIIMAAPVSGGEIPSGPIINSNPTTRNNRVGSEIVIGKTKYELQTNRSMGKRILLLSNGNIPAVWTFSNFAGSTSYTDRGTGYNLMTGGGVWSPYPAGSTPITSMVRIEGARTGFANYGATNNDGSEVVITHNSDATNHAYVSKRTPLGTGNWSNAVTTMPMCWTRIATGGTNNNTVHLIATMTPASTSFVRYKGIYIPLIYSRSTDGGTNWTTADLLPGYDSTIIKKAMAEDYAIDANGNTVAIVLGGYYNDAYLFKSTDDGVNWSKKLIWHFPDAPFNPDSIAPTTDTVPCFDGSFSVVIDNSGQVHVWGGTTRFLQTALGSYSYYPSQCGMIYWRDDMPTITGDLSLCSNFCWPWNTFIDRNGNGIWDCVQHQGWVNMPFNVGGTSMPGGSIGADGHLYVAFQHMSDADPNTFHIYGTDTVPYRHIFAIVSCDNGSTWSDAVELTPFDEGIDYVYPSVVKNTTDSLRLLYEENDLPGTSLNPSTGNPKPAGYEHDIVYLSVPLGDFSCTSTPEKSKEVNNITVYPNPANDYTNITYTLAKAGSINISVINIMGQKVSSYKIDGIKGKNYKQLNIENFASGIYVVKIEAEGKLLTQKLIVN
ncbi:MAG: T9SS type A sorting domain-containing protein [Bacteroidales bacterium]|jgi:hypothetical protein